MAILHRFYCNYDNMIILQTELQDLRFRICAWLGNIPEVDPLIKQLSFAQCTYLLSIFRLETLRLVFQTVVHSSSYTDALIQCCCVDSGLYRNQLSRPRGRGFNPHRRHCFVSLSKNINPSLVLVQPRKTRPYITERLFMGR